MSSIYDKASLILSSKAAARKAGKMLCFKPKGVALDFTRASEATEVDKNGNIVTVPANMPRFDHSGGGCPTLLLEPQRTNIHPYSEDLEALAVTECAVTNAVSVGPDGFTSAAMVVPTALNSNHRLQSLTNIGSFGVVSVYAKAAGYNFIQISDNLSGKFQNYNLFTGALGEGTADDAGIEDLGGGWYRCWYFRNGGFSFSRISVLDLDYSSFLPAFTGNAVSGVYLYGLQCEESVYVTSYIPTNGSLVTRVTDLLESMVIPAEAARTVLIKLAPSVDFSGSFGSIFDFFIDANNRVLIYFSSGQPRLIAISAGVTMYNVAVAINNELLNVICFKYAATESKLYVNGVLIYTGPGLVDLYTNFKRSVNVTERLRDLALYSTALTDAQCIELTT